MPPKKKNTQVDPLLKEIKLLNKTLEKVNSPKRKFLIAILSGFGTAIGAGFVAAIVFYIFAQILQTTGLEIPITAIYEPSANPITTPLIEPFIEPLIDIPSGL